MNVILTQKEKLLLEDLKGHEQICIQKYSDYANQVSDQQLKTLFGNHALIEQQHLNSINQLLNGLVPSMTQQGQGQNQQQPQPQQQAQQMLNSTMQQSNANAQMSDKDICSDLLITEKYVSGAYNTAIFECKDTQVRDVLNHIQKEEQKHGEAIFKYMESKGLYTPK